MAYQPIKLRDTFRVRQIVTVHYFEYDKSYAFTGEAHDFWELVYVDKGEADVQAGDRWRRLQQGELTFHSPGEFHNLRATGQVAPNLVVVSFVCKSPSMRFFANKIFYISDAQKRMLGELLVEAKHAFCSPLGDPSLQKLERVQGRRPIGCEQLVRINLERLLLSLRRLSGRMENTVMPRQRAEHSLAQDVTAYLEAHMDRQVTIEELANALRVSRTSMKDAFRKEYNMGIMSYFSRMKIERAKQLIREDSYNFTQIAARLGYDTIHHFSRRFKELTGLSPTEYARSVQANTLPPD